jgi:hypothetical protein
MALTHFRASGLVVSILATCLSVPVAGRAAQEDGRLRLASLDEGEAIVQAAWELRKGLGGKPDCSHFVKAVYAKAGFDYEYANSNELFDGVDSFQRVQTPQAGDLVVWQGHIGIVIDPVEHSFYSSVLSGFAIEDYRSTYWLTRGRPRFYRYLVDTSVPRPALPVHRGAEREVAAMNEPPALAEEIAVKHGAGSPESATVAIPAPIPAGNAAHTSAGDAARLEAVFVSVAKPSKDEVLAAVVRLADRAGERLAPETSLDSQPAVAVVDHFKVVKLSVNTSDRSGWAEVEVKQAASIQYGFTDLRPSTSKWRATLRHEKQGWVLLAPQDRIYIGREPAIQVLSNHLAVLSRMSANSQEVRRVMKVLDELLAEKSADAGAPGAQ